MAASDKNFIKYINDKKDRYEEGEEIGSDKLMQLADNKYRLLKEREEWDAPSAEEEKIIALEAAVESLTKNRNKRKANSDGEDGPSRKPKKQAGKGKGKKQNPPKPSWMFERPPEDELHNPRKWNGNDWWYCHQDTGGKCDGKYRRHKPKDCEGKAFRGRFGNLKNSTSKGSEHNNNDEKRLKIAEALTTIVNEQDDDNTSDGYES